MLDNYPPGAALDLRAPYNQPDDPHAECDEDCGEDHGCPNPGRHCRCEDCQNEMADQAYDEDR